MLVKWQFDNNYAGNKYLQVIFLVLKWDKINEQKGKHIKIQHLWLGSFQISGKIGKGTYPLKDFQGEEEKLPINGKNLKQYF